MSSKSAYRPRAALVRAAIKPAPAPIGFEQPAGAPGDRKTVTVLFADIANSTHLIGRLGPERSRTIVDPALQLMMDAVTMHHGVVAQVAGDGVLALFGADRNGEQHATSALEAAVAMQQAIRSYAVRVRDADVPPIEIRVGVSTGEVVVRPVRIGDAQSENLPIGQATNIAARIQSLAQAGAIVVSGETRRAAGEGFKFRRLGHHSVKGAEEAVEIFELLDSHAAPRPRHTPERMRMLLSRVAFRDGCAAVGAALGLVAALLSLTMIKPAVQPRPEEVALEMTVVRAYTDVSDWRDPKLDGVLYAALKTCERSKDHDCEFKALSSLRVMHTQRGELDEAEADARRMLQIAATSGRDNPFTMAWAKCAMGEVLGTRGLLLESIKQYDSALAIAERDPIRFPNLIDDPRPFCLGMSAIPLLGAGHIDQARRRVARSMELARQSREPFLLAHSILLSMFALGPLYDQAAPAYHPTEWNDEVRWIDEGIAVAKFRGYASVERELGKFKAAGNYFAGDAELGINEARELGFPEEAAVDEGLYRGGDYIYPAFKALDEWVWGGLPDQIRVRGELWLRAQPSHDAEAEECFRRAISLARNQDAKYFELKASLSLSQMLARQGKLEAARDALRPIYSWFTEGFDEPALLRSKKLLDELDAKIAAKPRRPLQLQHASNQ